MFLWAGASNVSGAVDDGNFLAISVTTPSETSGIRPYYMANQLHATTGIISPMAI